MQAYADENYEFKRLLTADGSPTVLMSSQPHMLAPEAMHNSAGALTESLYIYYENLKSAHHQQIAPRYLSMGLGLGYNEAIIACHILKETLHPAETHILSFEINEVLRSQYLLWLTADKNNPAATFWLELYNEVLVSVAQAIGVDAAKAKALLGFLYNRKSFVIENDLVTYLWPPDAVTFGSILFDAFSKKSTPQLWNEEFLTTFLKNAAAADCILTTYAATGTLNRALKNNNFSLISRSGFHGKRESTWAERKAH